MSRVSGTIKVGALLIIVAIAGCGSASGPPVVPPPDEAPLRSMAAAGDGETLPEGLNVDVQGPGSPAALTPVGLDAVWPAILIILYCALIVAASLGGGALSHVIELNHTRMQLVVSVVAGLMLGVGLFHMLPHAVNEVVSIDRAVWWMMIGLLTMFFLIRAFHFHQHGPAKLPELSGHAYSHAHDPRQAGELASSRSPSRRLKLSWTGVTLGLAVHTLIDGMAVAASVQADSLHAEGSTFLGAGTFLAVLLHKPLDAVSITSLMAAGGWSAGWRNLVNVCFAVICPLGAILFFVGTTQTAADRHLLVGCALAFSAGVFLCISLGDLLPEIEFHAHDRVKLSAALLLGIALAYGIGFLEPDRVDSHPGGASGKGGAPVASGTAVSGTTIGHRHD